MGGCRVSRDALGHFLQGDRQPWRRRRLLAAGRALAAQGEAVRLWIDDPSRAGLDGARRLRGVAVVAWTADRRPEHRGRQRTGPRRVDRGLRLRSGARSRRIVRAQAPEWLEPSMDQPGIPVGRALCRAPARPALAASSAGPGAGLTKHFFYPGFTSATGGLLRESDLHGAAQALRSRRLARAPGHRLAGRAPGLAVLLRTAGARSPARPIRARRPPDPAVGHGRTRHRRLAARAGAARLAFDLMAAPCAAAGVRPPALGLRPEFRARRRFAGSRALGRRALRLADLPAGRRRPPHQARRLAGLAGRPAVAARLPPSLERHGSRSDCRI